MEAAFYWNNLSLISLIVYTLYIDRNSDKYLTEEFKQEIELLLNNVKIITESVGYRSEIIGDSLNNILQAIETAKVKNAGVHIG
ncbi:MAG: hypothetical protein QNJ32_03290 [Xenococcaceae cyanobacterium MO_167.B27]|nr:hypothetical protein [Xenococcaceae cyanobacterium MO_167.B27]